jgi:hypothetical protein
MDRLAAASKRFSKAYSRSLFPAGNSHHALMLGPFFWRTMARYDISGFDLDSLTEQI